MHPSWILNDISGFIWVSLFLTIQWWFVLFVNQRAEVFKSLHWFWSSWTWHTIGMLMSLVQKHFGVSMKLEMLVTTLGDPNYKAHWLRWRSSMSWKSPWFLVDNVKEINLEIWVIKGLFWAQVMFSTSICWISSFKVLIHFDCIWQLEEAVVTEIQSIGSDLGVVNWRDWVLSSRDYVETWMTFL